jgi:hypothetical protein
VQRRRDRGQQRLGIVNVRNRHTRRRESSTMPRKRPPPGASRPPRSAVRHGSMSGCRRVPPGVVVLIPEGSAVGLGGINAEPGIDPYA